MAKDPTSFFGWKEPQSVLKHAVLEGYLRAWSQIIAKNFNRLYYVDGFSGPAYYQSGEECSPAVAARVLSEASAKSRRKPSSCCWHVEKDIDIYRKLLVDVQKMPQTVTVKSVHGEFHEHLPNILRDIRPGYCPAFFFIDPFGFTVHYEDLVNVYDALKDRKGTTHAEVLVNYATASIQQWLTAPNSEQALDRFFGTPLWREVVRKHGHNEQALLQLYEAQLRKHWTYVLSVEIPKPGIARTYFHLVFATDSDVAVRIMKHVMSKAKDQGWQQLTFFDGLNFDTFKSYIHEEFRGQTVAGRTVIARAIEQHPYLEADVERAVMELIHAGVVFALRNGKSKLWDWMLMFDLPPQ